MLIDPFTTSEIKELESLISILETVYDSEIKKTEKRLTEISVAHRKRVDALIHALEFLEDNAVTSKAQ